MSAVALSIRQPWATLIVLGYKDIENRQWPSKYRGPLYIHAGKTMSRMEWQDAKDFATPILQACCLEPFLFPSFDSQFLAKGGIIGKVTMTDCVEDHPSPWFMGDYGFVFKDATAIPFRPLKGQLGFFPVDV